MKQIFVEFDSGASLELEVDDAAELDEEFEGRCLDTGETLRVKGWLISTVEEL